MPTTFKDFKIKEGYARLIDKALWSYLWEGVYKPMFEIMAIKPELKAKNDIEDNKPIIEALRDGKIYYIEGKGFKAKDKFNNRLSTILENWGAKYDKWEKVYTIPKDKIPSDILVAIAENKMHQEEKIKQIQKYLDQVINNIPLQVESMVFDSEVITIIDDAGKEVKKNIRKIAVIEPELDEEQKKLIAKEYTNNMQFFVKGWEENRIKEMRQKVQQLVLEGYREDKIQHLLVTEYNIAKNKAKFLAQNETSIMLAELKKATYQSMGFDKFIWRTITDGKERDLHRHLNGTTWSYDSLPVIDERTGERGLPGQTYNCLVGNMNISSPFLQNRIFRRKFTGETTKLILPMGSIEITPNHPILTNRGWIAAKSINIGDHIAKISNKALLGTGINPNYMKTTIEEFFGFYSILFNPQRVTHSDLDFHSDVSIDKQVDIINIEDKLGDYFKPGFNQFILEQVLTESNKLGVSSPCNRAFYQAFPFCTFASDGFISSLSEFFSFFFSSEFHSVEHSLGSISLLDTLLIKAIGYSTTRDSKFFSELFNTPSGTIKFYQLIVWDFFFNCFKKNIIPLLQHNIREMSATTAETLGNINQANTFFIEFDTVIDKVISKSSSLHIYNLENSNNWYLTENYITKNCRCQAQPYTDGMPFTMHNQIDEAQSRARMKKYLEEYQAKQEARRKQA